MIPPAEALRRTARGCELFAEHMASYPMSFPTDLAAMSASNASALAGRAPRYAAVSLIRDRDIPGYRMWTERCGLARLAAARNRDPAREQEYWGPIFLDKLVVVIAGGHHELAREFSRGIIRRSCDTDATEGLPYQQLLAPLWADIAEDDWVAARASALQLLAYATEHCEPYVGVPTALVAAIDNSPADAQAAVKLALREHRLLCESEEHFAHSPSDHLICWQAVALMRTLAARGMTLDLHDPLIPEGSCR